MATTIVFLVILVAVFTSASTTFAKDFIVGDQVGWTTSFNYKAWAATKEFHVGDRLVFRYPLGAHNVYKVTEAEFMGCNVPVKNQPFNSGNDIITLSTPGKKWYICGVSNHCLNDQKLVITVLPKRELAPSQPPTTVVPPAPRILLPWIVPTPTPYVSELVDYETVAPSQPPTAVAPQAPSVQLPWIAHAPTPHVYEVMDYETAAPSQPPAVAPQAPKIQLPWIAPTHTPFVSKVVDYETIAPSQPPAAVAPQSPRVQQASVAPSAPRVQPPWITHAPAPYFF